MASFSESQNAALTLAERLTSTLSLAGLAFIFLTFTLSPKFRKPINRLMFYSAWGDALYHISTLIATAGMQAGQESSLCQFQGFMIEMFLLSDVMWNLSMAINVYLTVFAKYDSAKLKSLEKKYLILNYGVPFVVALTLCFVQNESRGKVYGPALIWCWISIQWDFLRITVLYAPAWIMILTIGIIYLAAGLEIFRKRRELQDFGHHGTLNSSAHSVGDRSGKATDIKMTTEMTTAVIQTDSRLEHGTPSPPPEAASYAPYSITIEGRPPSSKIWQRPGTISMTRSGNKTMNMERNRTSAAWAYTKCAILFFVALLITWLPSSINRVYSVIHPTTANWPLNLAAAIVLPLMGFWNTLIYVFISWSAVRELFTDLPFFRSSRFASRGPPTSPLSCTSKVRSGRGVSIGGGGGGGRRTRIGGSFDGAAAPWLLMGKRGGASGSGENLTSLDLPRWEARSPSPDLNRTGSVEKVEGIYPRNGNGHF